MIGTEGFFFFFFFLMILSSFLFEKQIAPGERIGIQVDGESFSSVSDSDGEFLSSFACRYPEPSWIFLGILESSVQFFIIS